MNKELTPKMMEMVEEFFVDSCGDSACHGEKGECTHIRRKDFIQAMQEVRQEAIEEVSKIVHKKYPPKYFSKGFNSLSEYKKGQVETLTSIGVGLDYLLNIKE